MKTIASLFCACLCCTLSAASQTQKTTLSAQIYGYQQEMVYFDCAQTPLIRSEFHTNPGEEHIYSFETDRVVSMFINGRTTVLLTPGDSIHADIHYEGKAVQSVEFGGTEKAVRQNIILQDISNLKRDMNYKSQLLACAVVDVKPADRIRDSRILLKQVDEMLRQAGDGISPEAAAYIAADAEAAAYNSFMEYPVMYAEIRKKPIEEQGLGEDYWKIMDNCKLRSDKASLQNAEYLSFLMRYEFYISEKKAREAGVSYRIPNKFEDMYHELAAFYTGDQRDAVLYMLICNFIRNGKEIERAEAILKDYKEKYNKDTEYVRILDSLLQ